MRVNLVKRSVKLIFWWPKALSSLFPIEKHDCGRWKQPSGRRSISFFVEKNAYFFRSVSGEFKDMKK